MQKKVKDTIILLFFLIAIFQIYIYTTFPAFKTDDSPATITSAYTLGICHPPGYPLFTMAGKVFSLLPVGSPAFRVNLFSVFLAVIILFLSYFLIRQNTLLVFGYENKIINFSGVFILAFSYIFWNQAIEAKGGIYMLNLLFFVILIYLSMELFKSYNVKCLYLMSFIYGLSLSNHWPSMIILLPVFGYFFLAYHKKMNSNNVNYALLFLILGFSPYFYLSARSGTDGIYVFMVKTNTWETFWKTILRTVYGNAEPLRTSQLYKDQITEFLKLFFNDFSFLWGIVFFGGYALLKKSKKVLFFYSSAFLITVFMVVFYNTSAKQFIYLIDNFLIPAQYILFIFILQGICFILGLLDKKTYKYIFLTALTAVILYSGFRHFKTNNDRYNYLSYDFGNNVLITIEPGSFYLPAGNRDYITPITYQQWVENKANNINVFTLYDLFYKWGIDDFVKKYGQIQLEPYKPEMNISNIIEKYFPKSNIYFSNDVSWMLKDYINNLKFKTKGLLFKATAENEYIPANIFKQYSYRGIFDAKSYEDKTLVSEYSKKLATQADEFFKEKRYTDAIQAFKYALLFPENPQRADMYCELSFFYGQINDVNDQIECLKKAIDARKNFYMPYEMLGMICYNNKLWQPAREMFENAIQYGSPDRQGLEQYISAINRSLGNRQ